MGTATDTQVEAVMSSPVETISKDATVREAADAMRGEDINALLVPGAEMGILTSTDVLDAIADGQDADSTTVGDVMTAPVESVTQNLQLQEAAAMMTTYEINHLPVRDSDGDYVGMVSTTDIRQALVDAVE